MANELVDQIKKEVSTYGASLGEVGKLRVIGIVSRVLGLFLLIFTVVLLALALLSFGAVAIIHALSNHMPIWAASLIIGAMYFLLLVLAILCRKALFVNPFIRLMSKQIATEEELERKTVEAEHQVELQTMRLSNQVETATQSISMAFGLVKRIWQFIVSRKRKS